VRAGEQRIDLLQRSLAPWRILFIIFFYNLRCKKLDGEYKGILPGRGLGLGKFYGIADVQNR